MNEKTLNSIVRRAVYELAFQYKRESTNTLLTTNKIVHNPLFVMPFYKMQTKSTERERKKVGNMCLNFI